MPSPFDPIRIGSFEMRNRFIRSATYYGLADEEGFPNQENIDLMRRLSEDKVGLIVAGFAFVRKAGQEVLDEDGIHRDDQIPHYRRMTDAVHRAGGRIALQIAHGGLGTVMSSAGGEVPVVSVLDESVARQRNMREMTDEDIEAIIDAFGQAAGRVEASGFDAVQIHGAHMHLISEFLSPLTNRRTDKWGGSPENRMRFLVEVTRAVKKAVSDSHPVMIKLACFDVMKDGSGRSVQEGAEAARTLETEGICMVEVSTGIPVEACTPMGITKPAQEATYLEEVKVVRKATRGPLAMVAGLRSLPVIEDVLQSGATDCISLCRPLIREPDLIKRWKDGDTRAADCVSCGGCFNSDGIYCRILAKEAAKKSQE